MAAIVNGTPHDGGIRPFGATYFVFSDYLVPSLRGAALSHLGAIWVQMHGSTGVGEDGPAHQPVMHLAASRAISHLITLRMADVDEYHAASKIFFNQSVVSAGGLPLHAVYAELLNGSG